jgi:hypothetical protein
MSYPPGRGLAIQKSERFLFGIELTEWTLTFRIFFQAPVFGKYFKIGLVKNGFVRIPCSDSRISKNDGHQPNAVLTPNLAGKNL